jgi:hypothetical protein
MSDALLIAGEAINLGEALLQRAMDTGLCFQFGQRLAEVAIRLENATTDSTA